MISSQPRFFSIVTLSLTLYLGPLTLAEGQSSFAQDNSQFISDTYPHISALENAILGQSFPGQPLNERLEKMEMKAFGKVSTSPDMSERTDALDEYTDTQLHKKLLRVNTDDTTTIDSVDNQPSENLSDYPHVTSLEQAILDQTFVGQPLADRLSRMEIKAFGSASNSADLSKRTDALETYAEKKLHKQPLNNPDTDTATSSPQGSRVLSKVGQVLLGMAGGGMLGNGGMGFGGGGMGRQSPQQQEPEPPAVAHKEDPAVYEDTPPNSNARLITKVGWCEVQLFGHTFPAMHLLERLGQLNRELNLEPGKSDIQLMDDVGLMIKAVQSRKQSAPIK